METTIIIAPSTTLLIVFLICQYVMWIIYSDFEENYKRKNSKTILQFTLHNLLFSYILHSTFYFLLSTFCILHSTFSILHSTFCILHSTFYILHSAFYILHSAFYILHSTFYILHSTFCILHSTFCILHSTFYILHSTFCILHSTFINMFTTDITKIPTNAGIYLFKDKKWTILYIGKAKNLQKRLGQYFSPNSLRKQEMLDKADKVDFLMVKNESEALYLEDNMIKQHQPEYNNLLKADNSYVYIKITKESFPQIFLTRKKINDNALYIGPKNDTIQLKKFLQYLRQILKFRGCKTTQFRQGKLCSDYYFWLCRGRCKLAKEQMAPLIKGEVSADADEGFVSDYKNIITTITSFFKWNTKPIEQEIYHQIEEAIIHENFERAAQLRDIYTSLQWFVEKQNVVLPEKKDGYLALMKTIGTKHIYTVLIFIKGKMMDVITSKEQESDIQKDSLSLAIQRTFGEGKSKTNKNDIQITSKSLTKLGIKTMKELWKLAENFLESYIISQSLQEESTMINDMFATLKTRYGLKNIPYKIECIDISHLSGWRTSGWLSCLMAGLPYKKWYRKYKIQAKKSDDYEALQELLERRIKSWWELPNLLIIDGGKGQLGVVKRLCKDPERKKIVSQIDIISLGKGEARKKSNIWKTKPLKSSLIKEVANVGEPEDLKKPNNQITEIIYTLDQNLKTHEIPMVYDQADKIFLKARDEAHRFANSYRKKQMSQERK